MGIMGINKVVVYKTEKLKNLEVVVFLIVAFVTALTSITNSAIVVMAIFWLICIFILVVILNNHKPVLYADQEHWYYKEPLKIPKCFKKNEVFFSEDNSFFTISNTDKKSIIRLDKKYYEVRPC